jgi:hypothetical protein
MNIALVESQFSSYNDFDVNDDKNFAANNAGLLPRWKIIAALSTSIVTAADILDYLIEPVFTVPLIMDIPDSFFVAALYLITKRADYLHNH